MVTYDDGIQVWIHGNKLNNLGLDDFQGWQCDAGFNRICVQPDTRVFSSECENDYLGRLDDNSFQLYSQPSVCKRPKCVGNADDLMTRKTHPDHPRDN